MQFWDDLLDMVICLLPRTYSETETSIFKSADSYNNPIIPLLNRREKARAIILYSEQKEFLVSSLKAPGQRQFVRILVNQASNDARHFDSLRKLIQGRLTTDKARTMCG